MYVLYVTNDKPNQELTTKENFLSCTLNILRVSRSQTHLPSTVLALVTITGCLLRARPMKEMQKCEDVNSLSTGDPPYVFPDNATLSTNKSVLKSARGKLVRGVFLHTDVFVAAPQR